MSLALFPANETPAKQKNLYQAEKQVIYTPAGYVGMTSGFSKRAVRPSQL
jgi:hypothetical protein